MQKTYLFYDIETTGLNKCFDQVLQFAAIRTDLELNELERHEILVKLNPDIVPAPMAIITHGISIAEAKAGVCEYEAISEVHQLMNQPGTISLGYNTIDFDDELLRFSFYRNLLTPYTHQYANGCSRMDIYPMTVMYFLYKNAALTWPQKAGKVSFKLEDLSAANNLASGNAHDAMVDVIATMALAKKLSCYQDMWQYLCGYFDKNEELQRMAKWTEAIMVGGRFGADNNYQIPVLKLGTHNHYKNQTLWLRLDLPELRQTAIESIAANTYVVNKKSAKCLLLPTNKHFMQHFTAERLKIIDANKQWLNDNPELFQEIVNYHKEYKYPPVPNADIDATLYQDGFLSKREQDLCAQFHAATIEQKVAMLDQLSGKLHEQAIRLLGRNYPDVLPDKYQPEFADYLSRINTVLVDYKNENRFTPSAALHEITALKKSGELTAAQQTLLDDLKQYIAEAFDNNVAASSQ